MTNIFPPRAIDDASRATNEHRDVAHISAILDVGPIVSSEALDRIMDAGALDAWTTAIVRPVTGSGLKVDVLVASDRQDSVLNAMCTALPVRHLWSSAVTIHPVIASEEEVTTRFGDVRIGHRVHHGRVVDIAPDVSDCRALALQHDVPVTTIWNEAHRLGEVRIGQTR